MKRSISVTGITCPGQRCGSMLPPPTDADFADYFEGQQWICPVCNHHQSLWALLLERMKDDHPLVPSAASLGLVGRSMATLELKPDEIMSLEFADYGVPAEATVIAVVTTPKIPQKGHGLTPAMGIQNLQARGLPHVLNLFPVPLQPMTTTAELVATEVNIMIIWIPSPSEPELEPLLSAVKAFTTGDFRGAIIPAQITVELKLSQVLTKHFSQFAGKDKVKSFLKDGASYGHQRRFLLPSLFGAVGAPKLSAEVSTALQSLNTKRNNVGHEHHATERAEAAPMLLASLFGYRYLSIYGDLLAPTT